MSPRRTIAQRNLSGIHNPERLMCSKLSSIRQRRASSRDRHIRLESAGHHVGAFRVERERRECEKWQFHPVGAKRINAQLVLLRFYVPYSMCVLRKSGFGDFPGDRRPTIRPIFFDESPCSLSDMTSRHPQE